MVDVLSSIMVLDVVVYEGGSDIEVDVVFSDIIDELVVVYSYRPRTGAMWTIQSV